MNTSEMSKAQLQVELDKIGATYKSRATKTELQELLDQANEAKESSKSRHPAGRRGRQPKTFEEIRGHSKAEVVYLGSEADYEKIAVVKRNKYNKTVFVEELYLDENGQSWVEYSSRAVVPTVAELKNTASRYWVRESELVEMIDRAEFNSRYGGLK